jgi:tetratricopeptide (TPR) repeat protein/predicted membrane-bound mannosyltransferase
MEALTARKGQWLLLAGVILLGTVLRFCSLGAKSLWGDEINTAVLFVQMPLTYSLTHLHPNNHTLYTLLAHLLTLGGISEFLLRIPAAMLGIAAIPTLYQLGRIAFGSTTGLIAAFLVAISPYHLWFSQEARGYTGVVLFSALSLYFLFQAARLGRRRYFVGFVLTTALALYVHLFAILLLGAELCILGGLVLEKTWRQRRNISAILSILLPWAAALLVLGLVLVVLYAPLWLAFLGVIDPTHGGAYLDDLSYTTDWALDVPSLIRLLQRFGGSVTAQWHTATTVSIACFWLGVVMGLRDRRRFASMLASLLLLPFLFIATIAAQWSNFYVYSRFLIFLLPIYLILVANGVNAVGTLTTEMVGRWSKASIPARLACCVLTVGLLGVPSVPALHQVYDTERQDWRGVADYLKRSARPGDLVIQVWLLQPNSLEWYLYPDDDTLEVLQASELRTKAIDFKADRQLWWVFVHDGQSQALIEEVGETFEVAVFPWIAVLYKKSGVESPEEALDATVTLTQHQGRFGPSDGSAYHALAEDLLLSGGFDQARFYADRGVSQSTQGAWNDAIESFQLALRCWPDWGLPHTKLGNAYRELGLLDDAEQAYRTSIQVEPGYVGAYLNLGSIYEEQGWAEEAWALYEQAVEVAADSAWAHNTLGGAYLSRGNISDALAHLRRAVELEPEGITWLLALADAYRELDQYDEARVTYRQILAQDPGNAEASEALRALAP